MDDAVAYLWVAIGGALGSVARYALGNAMTMAVGAEFPWGTLLINVLGSFVISFFSVLTGTELAPAPALRGAGLRDRRVVWRLHHLLRLQPADSGTGTRRATGAGGALCGSIRRFMHHCLHTGFRLGLGAECIAPELTHKNLPPARELRQNCR